MKQVIRMKFVVSCLACLFFFISVPAFASFQDNGDDTVTDSETGLIWQKTPSTQTKNWLEALAGCASLTLGGQSNWRLPSRNELQSIVDYRWSQPAVNSSSFLEVISSNFWTSTTDVVTPSSAYTVDFSGGAVSSTGKTGSSYVIAVRGGVPPTPSETFFHDNQDGTVTDSRTGLVWLRAPLDLDNDDATDTLIWQEALAGAVALDRAGLTDWRLPSRNELQSIVDYRWHHPAVDNRSFPKVISGDFWTSTTDVATPSRAYAVDFSSGAVRSGDKVGNSFQVLVVRGQQKICPADTDTDGDGIKDCNDSDDDNDGLADTVENQGCTDTLDADTDDDGIPDGTEDVDHDGAVGSGETDPCDIDSDDDGIQDGTELGYTVVDVGTDTDLSIFQPDLDPASTTDAINADSDGDGISDGVEDSNHNGRVDVGETDPTTEQRSFPLPGILLLLLK